MNDADDGEETLEPGDADPVEADGASVEDAGNAGAEGASEPGDGSLDILAARERALEAADALLDNEVEDVIKVESRDDGWRVVVEVVERPAVPDTQDILGRYELLVDDDGTIAGYSLVERYKRSETKSEL
jgi:hypothetical protein